MPHVDLTTFGWTIKMSLVLINELLNGSVLHKCQNLIWNVKIILRNVGWGVGGGLVSSSHLGQMFGSSSEMMNTKLF